MRAVACIAVLCGALAGACSGDDDRRDARAPTSNREETEATTVSAEVAIELFRYRPETISVGAGDVVTWRNADGIGHTVTAGSPERRGSSFDEAVAADGGTASVAFPDPGEFAYFCTRHEFMRGVVVVG